MSPRIEEWLLLLGIVIVPLIPAIVIFKLFPDTTGWIGGKLRGIKFNFAGAFAGYVLVLLFLGFIFKAQIDRLAGKYEVYTISGTLQLEPPPDTLVFSSVKWAIEPAKYTVDLKGKFQVPAVPLERGEEEQVPNLSITRLGYSSESVPLTTNTTRFGYGVGKNYTIEKKGRIMTIKEVIVLTKSEHYDHD